MFSSLRFFAHPLASLPLLSKYGSRKYIYVFSSTFSARYLLSTLLCLFDPRQSYVFIVEVALNVCSPHYCRFFSRPLENSCRVRIWVNCWAAARFCRWQFGSDSPLRPRLRSSYGKHPCRLIMNSRADRGRPTFWNHERANDSPWSPDANSKSQRDCRGNWNEPEKENKRKGTTLVSAASAWLLATTRTRVAGKSEGKHPGNELEFSQNLAQLGLVLHLRISSPVSVHGQRRGTSIPRTCFRGLHNENSTDSEGSEEPEVRGEGLHKEKLILPRRSLEEFSEYANSPIPRCET